jgi:hypothetical protein
VAVPFNSAINQLNSAPDFIDSVRTQHDFDDNNGKQLETIAFNRFLLLPIVFHRLKSGFKIGNRLFNRTAVDCENVKRRFSAKKKRKSMD